MIDIRHDLGIVPIGHRVELEKRVVDRTQDDDATTTVLLLNRDDFEQMFSQEGVRVMVSDLVPSGSAFVIDLERIRADERKRRTPYEFEFSSLDALADEVTRPVLGLVITDVS